MRAASAGCATGSVSALTGRAPPAVLAGRAPPAVLAGPAPPAASAGRGGRTVALVRPTAGATSGAEPGRRGADEAPVLEVSRAAGGGAGMIWRLIRSPVKPVTITVIGSPGSSVGGSSAATRNPSISSKSVNPFDASTTAPTMSPESSRVASVWASAASAASSSATIAARLDALLPRPRPSPDTRRPAIKRKSRRCAADRRTIPRPHRRPVRMAYAACVCARRRARAV